MMIKIIRFSLFLVVVLLMNAEKSVAYEAAVFGKILWVIDGDTYQISHTGASEGEPVRARHFNTPEKGDLAQCPAEAEKARLATGLAKRLLPRGSAVVLSDFGRDRYGRLLATVTLADGRDLASLMIGAGLAVPYEGGRRQSWCAPFLRRRHDGLKKGLSAPRTVKGKCRAAPVIGGRDAPKIRKRIASRPSGFGSYPARPPTLDRAHPDFTTGKRCAGQWEIGSQGAPDGRDQAMARVNIHNSNEIFGSDVTIAHLAIHSFQDVSSDDISIYDAAAIVRRDWPFEVADIEMEYTTGIRVMFKDGSCLSVGAWAEGEG